MTKTVEIALPAKTFLRTIEGEAVYLDWAELPASVLPRIMEVGAKTVLTNAYNGGGASATDAEKAANMQKKLDAWKRGEFEVTGGGKTSLGQMKDAYIDKVIAATGCGQSDVEKAMKATIVEVLGKDAKGSMDNFLTAHSKLAAKAEGEKRDAGTIRAETEAALLAHYAKLADARSKAVKGLDLTAITL